MLSINIYAQMSDEFRLKGMFVYNFTRMVSWPSEYQTGDFIIYTFGNSPINKEISDIAAQRTVGNRNIVHININNVNSISRGHIIFIPRSESRNISNVYDELKRKKIPALIITETESIHNKAVINFIVAENRLRFQLNDRAGIELGLNFGTEILRLAVQVN